MRKATMALALLAALAVVAAGAVPRLVSMESFRPRVTAAIEGKTGRAVSFSRIRLSLFPAVAIRLSEFHLAGPPSRPGESLVSAPVAEFRMAVWSILAGRNEFDTLLLSRPRVTIRQRRDGTYSAADVLGRLAAEDPPPGRVGAAPVDTVALKRVRVDEGTLSVFFEEEGAPDRRWDFTPFSLRVSGIGGPEKPFLLSAGFSGAVRGEVRLEGSAVRRPAEDGGGVRVRASGKAFGEKIAVEGTVSGSNGVPEADLSLVLPKVEAARLAKAVPALSSPLERLRPKGVAKVSAKVSGDARSLGFEVEADLTRAAWTVAEGLEKFIDAPCTVVIEGRRFPGVLAVSNAELRFPPLLLIANASLSTTTGAREWAASARMASLAEFARSRGGAFSKWSPVGKVVLAGGGSRASGTAGETYRIDADLSGVGAVFPGRGPSLSGFNGHVSVSPETVEFSPLAGLVNGQRFHLRGKVSRSGVPAGTAELQMGYLDLDTLLRPSEGGDGRKGAGGEDIPEWLADVRDRGIAFTAAVSIDAGNFGDAEFSRLSGTIRYGKGALSFDGVRGSLYGGHVVLSGALAGSGKSAGFRTKLTARNVDIVETFRRNAAIGKFLSGRVSFDGELAGSRVSLDEFLRAGAGSGSLRIVDGKMNGVDLPALSAAAAGGGKVAAGSGGGGGDTPFRELSADVSIEGGKARFSSLRILIGGMELSGDASVGLTDHTVEMLGTLWVPRETASKAPWAGKGFSVSARGEAAVPLVISGTLHAPVVVLDASAVGRGPGRMLRTGPPGRGKR
ncbi:MAG: AsmA family protein [Deltaproteobacteria bacterium]|nr:MAG: AsmA family protein [Deltaproteobacteria bacterium]